MIVDANSASPQLPGVTYYGVEATHSQMCKFDSANAPGFRAVSTDIRQWVLDAPSLVSVRWEVEESEIAARMCNELQERFSISERMPSIPSIVCFFSQTSCNRAFFTDSGYLGISTRFHHWHFTTSPWK